MKRKSDDQNIIEKIIAIESSIFKTLCLEKCSICLDYHIKGDTIMTSCKHEFGRICFTNWMTKDICNHCCPNCREKITHIYLYKKVISSTKFNAMLNKLMERFIKYLNFSKLEYKQYQYDGVRWMLNNELMDEPVCSVRGGFIADEMGLGKTIMMIALMLCNFRSKTLIVVPPILIQQWYDTIFNTTKHEPLIYHGKMKKNISMEIINSHKIVITTYGAITLTVYDVINNETTLLHRIKWSRIIFDEAHHLRNSKTTIYNGAKMLSGQIKWLVSGTPIQNSKSDFYSLCSIIGIPKTYYSKTENLKSLAKAFILKRTKKQLGIKMKKLVIETHIVKWGNQKEMDLAQGIHSLLSFSNVSPRILDTQLINCIQHYEILPLFLLARQSCIYPKLLSDKLNEFNNLSCNYEYFNYSSKLNFIVDKILQRKDNGRGKLIFCHFYKEMDEIAARLRAKGINEVAIFDGRTCFNNRNTILQDKNKVLILQVQTGCEGLNLQQNYSEIYFVSPHWNPAVEAQAIARCHRIGQKKTVYVEKFVMDSFPQNNKNNVLIDTVNIEKYASSLQEFKREIAQEILE
jgi:hypothetical protein